MVAAETEAKAAPRKPRPTNNNPNTLEMVVEAITALNERKGASVPGIKNFITDKYSTVDPKLLKYRLKKAIVKGMEQGILIRPKGSEDAGASLSGRFRLDKAKMAAMEKAKQPKPKPKPKAEKPKAKKPKPEKSKSPKVAKTKAAKAGTGVKNVKEVKTKKPKAGTSKAGASKAGTSKAASKASKSPAKTKDKPKKAKLVASVGRKTPKKTPKKSTKRSK